jgi:metal-responsive CopG/Arc/MetJ family transcriptional regulator
MPVSCSFFFIGLEVNMISVTRTIRIDPQTLRELDNLAALRGVSRSALVKFLVRRAITEENERKTMLINARMEVDNDRIPA